MYSFFGALAFVVWGLVPIYFHQLSGYEPLIVLANRVFWSAVILIVIGLIRKDLVESNAVIFTKRNIVLSALAGVFMNISWLGFVYASVNDNLMAASLAFYITPVFVFITGLVVFKEKVSRNQIISLVLMIAAVIIYAASEGFFPKLSILIASFFTLYITIKKYIKLNTLSSLILEHLIYMPIALIYILSYSGEHNSVTNLMLLAGTAPLQLIPVLLMTISLIKTPLSKISFLQYIEPTLHLMLAVWVFNEPVADGQKYALVIIFISIAISSIKKGKKSNVIN
jgi:chloramphenicol-sensitive protein RarD